MAGWTEATSSMSAGSIISTVLSIGLTIGILVLAIKHHRNEELGGFISFGRGFQTGMLTTFFYAIIATVWMFVFINFVDTDMIENIQSTMVEQWEEQGLTDEQIEQAQSFTGFMSSKGFLIGAAFGGALLWGAILSLIISAVMKKDNPQTA